MNNTIILPSLETFEEIGEAFGRGFFRELAKYEAAVAENMTEDIANPDDEGRERVKTRIEDCRGCWCNTCATLEECENILDGWEPDGIRPLPCVGCFDGMRFKPIERNGNRTMCNDYVEGEENNA